MQISEEARKAGMSAKMIRHYEHIGLTPAPPRRDSNYRDYGAADVHRLAFVRRARDLSIGEIRDLLRLWADTSRSSADVKRLTQAHIADLEARIEKLIETRDTLAHLADCCAGSHRPDCPIIETLSGDIGEPAGP